MPLERLLIGFIQSISVIDPTNVSYIDQDDEDEENYRVKEVVATAKRQAPPQAQDSWEDGVQVKFIPMTMSPRFPISTE